MYLSFSLSFSLSKKSETETTGKKTTKTKRSKKKLISKEQSTATSSLKKTKEKKKLSIVSNNNINNGNNSNDGNKERIYCIVMFITACRVFASVVGRIPFTSQRCFDGRRSGRRWWSYRTPWWRQGFLTDPYWWYCTSIRFRRGSGPFL